LRGWNSKENNEEKRVEFLTNFILKGLGLDHHLGENNEP
jgi:hypothetical protein